MARGVAWVRLTSVLNALISVCDAAGTTMSTLSAVTNTAPDVDKLLSLVVQGATETAQTTAQTTTANDEVDGGRVASIAAQVATMTDQATAQTTAVNDEVDGGRIASIAGQIATLTDQAPAPADTQAQSPQTSIDPNIYYLPALWSAPAPAVACEPPCNIVLPPYTLSTSTVFSFDPLTTVLTEQWSHGSETLTKSSSTVFSFAPLTTSVIPWFNLNITAAGSTRYSLTPSVFPTVTGSIAPPPEISSESALPFTITSFPPEPQTTDGPPVVPFPFPEIEGAPLAVELHTGPPPSSDICQDDCIGGAIDAGLGLGCGLFCNSCDLVCDVVGGLGGSGSSQCVGSGCGPPGGASHGGSHQDPPPPGSQPPPPDPVPTGGPGPAPTVGPEPNPTTGPNPEPTTANSEQTTTTTSSSSSCEHTITVSDCQITCTDTATAGSIASQSSCYTGDCGSRVTGCSGEVTGTTTTTRTTTSVEACPYRAPPTPWYTAPDQPAPTLPTFEDLMRSWAEVGEMEDPDDQQPAPTSTAVTNSLQLDGIGTLLSIINDPAFTSTATSTTNAAVPTTNAEPDPEPDPATAPAGPTSTAEIDLESPIDIIPEPTLGPGGVDMSTPDCQACSEVLKRGRDVCMPEKMASCVIARCKASMDCQACGINCRKLFV